MELQEQLTALEAEKKQYIQIIDGLNAEKIALDQMYVESLKNLLSLKKELIILNMNFNKERDQNSLVQKELEQIKCQLKDKAIEE
jgi:hypothetical protein